MKDHIQKKIAELFHSTRKIRKQSALRDNKDSLRDLPPLSRAQVGQFIDEVLAKCPSINTKELSAVTEVLSRLERARTTYDLLYQLAQLGPDDLDRLDNILNEWSVREAKLVLDELDKRLKLIEQLEKRMDNPSSDELHEIQPLFEKGLWIFGPEYESLEFIANRTLNTVIRDFLKDDEAVVPMPRRRPDIIALPDRSLCVYSRDSYDRNSEVDGLGKILIVELKRGGFRITRKEKQQAQDYAYAIQESGKVQPETEIVAYVLGSTIDQSAIEPIKEGNREVQARAYGTVLRQAQARTFNLKRKIEEIRQVEESVDKEVEEVLAEPSLI